MESFKRTVQTSHQEQVPEVPKTCEVVQTSLAGEGVASQQESDSEYERLHSVIGRVQEDCLSAIEFATSRGFGPGDALKSLLKKPIEILEKRKALSSFESASKDIAEALNNPRLRHEALSFLSAVHEANKNISWTGTGKAFTGQMNNFVLSHIDRVSPRWDTDDGEAVGTSIEIIKQLFDNGEYRMWTKKKSDWRDCALSGIEQSIVTLPGFIEHVKTNEPEKHDVLDNIEEYLSIAFSHGTDESARIAGDIFESLLLDRKTDSDESCVAEMLKELLGYRSERIRGAPGHDLVRRALAKMGLDPEKFIGATRISTSSSKNSIDEHEFATRFKENTLAALKIEMQRSGAVKQLSETFGIQAYSRYPKDLLVHQYDNIDNIDDPYGIIVYPRADHNGAFYRSRNKTVFTEFAKDNAEAGHQVRVFECENRIDTAKKLITANKMYGDKQKIAYAIIGGHGNSESLVQGDEKKLGTLSEFTTDTILSGDGIKQAVSRFFVSRPTFIFDSCSVGEDDGIAQVFAEENDAEVYATDKPMKGIAVLHCVKNKETGRLDFNVRMDVDEGGRTKHIVGNEHGGKEKRRTKKEDEEAELDKLFG